MNLADYYKKLAEAPYNPGYEDAIVNPTPTYRGMDPAKMIWKTKPLSDEEIDKILESLDVYIDTHAGVKLFARAIEKRHGIK